MKMPTIVQKSILLAAFIATLVALYLSNTQYNYAISVALILLLLLVSISGVMTFRGDSPQEQTSKFNSRLAVTLLIVSCAIISIYLIKVSSEPIFSKASTLQLDATLAEFTIH